MVYQSGDEVEKSVGSRYSLVIAVSKRAKQLREGAPRLVDSKSKNPVSVALQEFAAGKLKIVLPTAEQIVAASRRQEILHTPKGKSTADLLRVPVASADEEFGPLDEESANLLDAEIPGDEAATAADEDTEEDDGPSEQFTEADEDEVTGDEDPEDLD